MEHQYKLPTAADTLAFYNLVRRIAYSLLQVTNEQLSSIDFSYFVSKIPLLEVDKEPLTDFDNIQIVGNIVRVICRFTDDGFQCFSS
ncbi:unnamed protein product [Anisakis simplex]|uniref:HORMA domain-containing protein n=1 Tax=Anisakis simplex TaxID=6269 RepID=A0A0M3JMM9_ANISI|nr:unnamed protein product [Anisakis simplex]